MSESRSGKLASFATKSTVLMTSCWRCLLNKRAGCARKVGEIKARHGDAGFIYRRNARRRCCAGIQDDELAALERERDPAVPSRDVDPACRWSSHAAG